MQYLDHCAKQVSYVVLSGFCLINVTILPAYSMRATVCSPMVASSREVASDLAAARARIEQDVSSLPLGFEANCGQAADRVQFVADAWGHRISLSSAGVDFTPYVVPEAGSAGSEPGLQKEGSDGSSGHSGNPQSRIRVNDKATVKMRLASANRHAALLGYEPLPGKGNYFLGNDPASWHTNVPMYASLRQDNVYPGISMMYHGNQGRLEYDFVVASGGDPRAIKIDFVGARGLRLDSRGNLIIRTMAGDICQDRPVAYQETGGVRTEVASRYVVKGKRRVEFRVG